VPKRDVRSDATASRSAAIAAASSVVAGVSVGRIAAGGSGAIIVWP
jgi:hypothetical protein